MQNKEYEFNFYKVTWIQLSKILLKCFCIHFLFWRKMIVFSRKRSCKNFTQTSAHFQHLSNFILRAHLQLFLRWPNLFLLRSHFEASFGNFESWGSSYGCDISLRERHWLQKHMTHGICKKPALLQRLYSPTEIRNRIDQWN